MTLLPTFLLLAVVLAGVQLLVRKFVSLETLQRFRPLMVSILFVAFVIVAWNGMR